MTRQESPVKTIQEVAAAIAVIAALALGLVLAAGSAARVHAAGMSGEQGSKTITVTIENFSFSPKTLTVPLGTTVTWVNRDDEPHNVVSTDKKFKSSILDTDDQFSYTFTTAGMYDYFCSLHPRMTAKVIVQ